MTLVVTQPDRPAGRGHRMQPTPVKVAATELGIPTIEPERLRDVVARLAAEDASFLAVASYGKIVPQAVLDLLPIAFNVHPSLLPLYRGATPLQSQIRDGVRASGVSIIAMDAGMDTGDVVLVRHAAIADGETYGELHERLAELGAAALADAVRAYGAGTLERTSQTTLGTPEEAARTLTRPLTKADLRVDLAQPFERVVRLVDALAPQPLARLRLGDEDLKIERARLAPAADDGTEIARVETTAGDGAERVDVVLRVLAGSPSLRIERGGEALAIDRVIPPSRGAVSGAEYVRGLQRRAVTA